MTRIFRKSRIAYAAPLTAIAVSAVLLMGSATGANAGHAGHGSGVVPGAIIGGAIGYGIGKKKGIIPGLIGGAIIGGALSSRPHASAPPPPPPAPLPAPIYNNKLVYDIQYSLTRLGYRPGPLDGVFGRMTADAISAYEYNNQLSVTAQPSQGLYAHMRQAGG